MPPQGTEITPAAAPNPQVAMVFGIIWLIFMLGMIASYVIMLVALWRGMRAHEQIAEKIGEIAEKLALK